MKGLVLSVLMLVGTVTQGQNIATAIDRDTLFIKSDTYHLIMKTWRGEEKPNLSLICLDSDISKIERFIKENEKSRVRAEKLGRRLGMRKRYFFFFGVPF